MCRSWRRRQPSLDEGNRCFGDVTNGSLTSSSCASVLPLLERLTR